MCIAYTKLCISHTCVSVCPCVLIFLSCLVHVYMYFWNCVSFYQFVCLIFMCFNLFFNLVSFCEFFFVCSFCVVLCFVCVCVCICLHVKVWACVNTTHADSMAFRTKLLHISIIVGGLSVKIFYSFPFRSSAYQFVIRNLKLR